MFRLGNFYSESDAKTFASARVVARSRRFSVACRRLYRRQNWFEQRFDQTSAGDLLRARHRRFDGDFDLFGRLPLELVSPPKNLLLVHVHSEFWLKNSEQLNEALDSYLVKAGEKMRRKNLTANAVTVFLATNRFAKTEQYSNSQTIELANATNSTRELRDWTKKALLQIYKQGYFYKKVGVILQGLQPETSESIRLYGESDCRKDKRLMKALDKISNKFGREAIKFGVRKNTSNWQMKAELKSRHYTTSLREVLAVR